MKNYLSTTVFVLEYFVLFKYNFNSKLSNCQNPLQLGNCHSGTIPPSFSPITKGQDLPNKQGFVWEDI